MAITPGGRRDSAVSKWLSRARERGDSIFSLEQYGLFMNNQSKELAGEKEKTPFEDVPLREEADIRILRLEPAENPNDPLFGRLEVYNLNDADPYDALSYTWGPAYEGQKSPPDTIFLNDAPYRCRRNLSDALRRLRQTSETRSLWIDALCIDQNNTSERNSQVQMTAQIFGKAQTVVAWLGEDSALRDGEYVFGLFRAMEDVKLPPRKIFRRERKRSVLTISQKGWEGQDIALISSHFLRRRYFSRRWIIPELHHAKQVEVLCGEYSVSWDVFTRGLDAVSNLEKDVGIHSMETLRRIRGIPHRGRSATSVLCEFQSFKCANPKDRILALSSLFKLPSFQINYSSTPEALSKAFALAALRDTLATNNGAVLNDLFSVAAQQAPEPIKNATLPSWIPDWDIPAPRTLATDEPGWTTQAEILDKYVLKTTIAIFGMIEALSLRTETFSLLRGRGTHLKANGSSLTYLLSEETSSSNMRDLIDLYCPTLMDGDLLCLPAPWSKAEQCRIATVIRPMLHEHVVKCRIVGQFPLKIFWEESGAEEAGRGGMEVTEMLGVRMY